MPDDLNAPAADPASSPASAAVTDPAAPAAAPAAPQAASVTDPASAAPADPAAPAAADPASAPQTPNDKSQVAPEQYEFAAPEGVKLDDAVVTGFKEVAKDLGLSQENAQKVIDKLAPTIAQRQSEAMTEAVEQARTQWGEQAAADPELIKGDAADATVNFQQNLATAKLAFKTYGTPELEKLLNESGIGNHPEVIRWAYRVGKNLQPDSQHVAGATPPGAKDARSLYPNSNLAP